MTYARDVHPEYARVRDDLEHGSSTFVLLPSLDREICVAETVRRQIARPFGRSSPAEEAVIRSRFDIYAALPLLKIETMRPVAAVVDEIVAAVSRRASEAGADILRAMPVIKAADFDDDRIKALLTRHLEGMHTNSPPGHVFALDWSGLQKPEISFYALWDDEELLGFGALKQLGTRAGEIKSMRTADAHLRKGVAAMILDHIIAEARRRGYARLSLETGSGPAFEPALTLYRKYGFTDGGAFGDYQKSPFNQFLHLDLTSHAT